MSPPWPLGGHRGTYRLPFQDDRYIVQGVEAIQAARSFSRCTTGPRINHHLQQRAPTVNSILVGRPCLEITRTLMLYGPDGAINNGMSGGWPSWANRPGPPISRGQDRPCSIRFDTTTHRTGRRFNLTDMLPAGAPGRSATDTFAIPEGLWQFLHELRCRHIVSGSAASVPQNARSARSLWTPAIR